MSRIRFDQLAKQYLEDFLEPFGRVQRNLEVPGESKFVDLWFMPTTSEGNLTVDLGLLNRIATTPCLLEPFRNSPTRQEIRSCLLKLLWLQEEHRRKLRRDNYSPSEQELPRLWILAATVSQPVITEFGGTLQTTWGSGIYHLPTANRAAIVAIDQLPNTLDTLWLRILGRDHVQQQAIAELLALPSSDDRRDRVLQLLINWRVTLELSELELSDNEEGTLMVALSQAYLEWEQARIQQGIQQGIERGIQQGIECGIQQGIERGIQQGIERGIQQGIERGIQQGVERGIQQGVEQGERLLILRLLTRRLRELPAPLVALIAQLTLLQLESLGEALLDFTTIADLIKWLLVWRLGEVPEYIQLQVAQLSPTQLGLLSEALPSIATIATLETWLHEITISSESSQSSH